MASKIVLFSTGMRWTKKSVNIMLYILDGPPTFEHTQIV